MENNITHFSSEDKCPCCSRFLDLYTEHWKEGEYPERHMTRSWYACNGCEQTFTLAEIDEQLEL